MHVYMYVKVHVYQCMCINTCKCMCTWICTCMYMCLTVRGDWIGRVQASCTEGLQSKTHQINNLQNWYLQLWCLALLGYARTSDLSIMTMWLRGKSGHGVTFIIWQHYKVVISARYDKSVPILIWSWISQYVLMTHFSLICLLINALSVILW